MTNGFEELSVELIGKGAALEMLNNELERAAENLRDLNTDPTATRTVKLEIKLKTTQERNTIAISFQASSKLAPDAPGADMAILTRDKALLNTARQMTLDDYAEESGIPMLQTNGGDK